MRGFFALAALLAGACGPAFAQPIGVCNDPNNTDPNNCGAFFEFAGTSGAGMTAACACITPTGAKGEVLTFTRASSGTCLKGGTVTGIANGDMVTCTNNQPRVMPGGSGLGPVGLLVEDARNNFVLRSQELDNAVWTKSNAGGGSIPTVTADFAVAPDGTTTADRVQFSACASAGDSSLLYQIGLTAGSRTGAIFCRGTSGTVTISGCVFNLGGSNGACQQTVCPSTSWTRVITPNFTTTVSGGPVFGCVNQNAVYTGFASTGAADVLLWGGQYEAATFVSSYIATAGAEVSRALETATFPASIATAVASSGSAAVTVVGPSNVTGVGAAFIGLGNTNGRAIYRDNATRRTGIWDGTNDIQMSSTSTYSDTVANRFNSDWSGSTMTVRDVTNSLTGTGSYDGAMTTGSVEIGYASWAFGAFLVLKQICLDPNPSRCR